jgi:hypothetical protein
LLGSATHVDLFFSYARTWRNAYSSELRQLVARDGTRLRVILPDRENALLVAQLAAKFKYEPDQLVAAIDEAESDFEYLRRHCSNMANVEQRRTSEYPVYTYYRFDGVCLVALYAQAPGRAMSLSLSSGRVGASTGSFVTSSMGCGMVRLSGPIARMERNERSGDRSDDA